METNNECREALNELLGLFDSGLVEYSDSCDLSDTTQIQYVIDKAQAALAEPVKNGEVGTAEEQYSRHCKWCASTRDFSCHSGYCRKCFAKWAQMPYTEGGAK